MHLRLFRRAFQVDGPACPNATKYKRQKLIQSMEVKTRGGPKDSARLVNIVLFGQSLAALWCYSALFFLRVQDCTIHYHFSRLFF